MVGEPGDSSERPSELERNLRARSTWLRLVFMIVIAICHQVAQVVEYLTFNTEVRPFPFDAEWPAPRRP